MKYRKKPVVIEAFRLGHDERPEWFMNSPDIRYDEIHGVVSARIYTLEGIMGANHGDYVIQGIKGEIYFCKPDIFEMTYDAVET